MCIIMHRTANAGVIPTGFLEYNALRNPDGFGLAWREDGHIVAQKWGPDDMQEFMGVLSDLNETPDIDFVAHFRFATHGAKCAALSHPFMYEDPGTGEPVYVFHNGIIDIKPGEGESDTSEFVKSILARLPSHWWENPALCGLLSPASLGRACSS
jgi:predicted glutamine amidotransferase